MKKQIVLFLMALMPAMAMAVEVEIDGLWYELVSKAKEAKVIKYKDTPYSGDIVIPAEVEYEGVAYSVTTIGEDAFKGCTGLTSITIPSSVTSIGYDAFESCTGLTSITIPSSVTSIEGWAFANCTGLTSVTIPSSVTSIVSNAFRGCTSLTSITIPSSVTSIGNWAFKGCTGLTSITIPSSVTSIGYYAFSECTGLTSVTIPSSVTSIESGTFSYCTGLTSVTIPSSVTSIWHSAFHNCSGLTSITIPSSVTSIGESAFAGCTSLTSITIPSSVTTIKGLTFAGCTSLTSITIPSSVTSIGYDAFYGCTGLTSVHITDIAAWCNIAFDDNPLNYAHHLFLNGEEINDLVIPSSVTSIANFAFSNCTGLTSVTIPSSVTSIGNRAFEGCSGLTEVYSDMVNPFILNNSLFPDSFKSSGTLFVPAGTRQYYIERGWGNYFINIVEMEYGEPIWLSIIDAEQGRTELKCDAGKSYTFRFEASDGWRVHSVTFRGSDVTSWLTDDGQFTTPAMSASTDLVVTYEQGTDAVKAIAEESDMHVVVINNDIVIRNAPAGTPIAVYDLSGRMIGQATAVEGATRVDVNGSADVVIVRIGQRSVKVRK